jgi:hypothetical protein
MRGEGRRPGSSLVWLPARRGGRGKRWRTARQHRPGGWRWLRCPKEGDDARGGPSGPQCWAQSKNGPEDLMGHHGEVGQDGLLRWQAGKMKKKLEITYGLQRSTSRIEMGRERKNIIVFAIF